MKDMTRSIIVRIEGEPARVWANDDDSSWCMYIHPGGTIELVEGFVTIDELERMTRAIRAYLDAREEES